MASAYPPPPGPPPPPQQAVEHGREPCPDRILDDIGGAFGMGALGGGAWHMYKGLKNSPKGYKLIGAVETVRRESPRIGGNFANWGLMFSVFDCTCLYVRKKVRSRGCAFASASSASESSAPLDSRSRQVPSS